MKTYTDTTDKFYRPQTRKTTGSNYRRTRINHKPAWIALAIIVSLAAITALSS